MPTHLENLKKFQAETDSIFSDRIRCSCGSEEFYILPVKHSDNSAHRGAFCRDCRRKLTLLAATEKKLTGNEVMPFGKHKGEAVRAVPRDYLSWVITNMERKGFVALLCDYFESGSLK